MIRARRVGIGLVLGAVVVLVVGTDWLLDTHFGTTAFLLVLACGALSELYRMLGTAGIPSHPRFGVAVTALLIGLRALSEPLGLTRYEARELFLAGISAAALAPLAWEAVRASGPVGPRPDSVRRAAATVFGLVYVTLLSSFLLELRLLATPSGSTRLGLELVFLLACCVKFGDSCAYFVGKSVGRTPLSPVSPKKTWEGSFGSLAGSAAVALGLGSAVFGFDWRVMLGFAVVVDLAGQGGDLVESYVKRVLGVKDSATTFGEMGGYLDMLDALLLAAPPAFLWAELLVARP